jgi:predicted dehydrogenase/nucleoside-diphosphate-sugar epimerase
VATATPRILTGKTESEAKKPDRAPPPLRLAIIGCGAITRNIHLPVLAGHDDVSLVALVDPDADRASELARDYNVPAVWREAAQLDPAMVDGAVVATPPGHHAACCIDLAKRGIHVFVEKPMAINVPDARAMVDAAQAAGVILTAGYFRRLFPNVRLLRAILESGAYGRVVGFDAEEGGEYTWRLASLSSMHKEQGGGGVLMDIGSHVLNLLLYLFPGQTDVLDYRDNALGGIETDCVVRLQLQHGGKAIEGKVELSRTRGLRNSLRITCERATWELRTGERLMLSVIPDNSTLQDPVTSCVRPIDLQARWGDEPESAGYEGYRAEIDDWLEAIHTGNPPVLSGRSALQTVELIDRCYTQVRRIDEPWVWNGLPLGTSEQAHQTACNRMGNGTLTGAKASAPRRVLVTGASGFIGCRVAEVLHLGKGWQVRALVHKPGSAARLARLPVDMVQGDLKSPDDMARAVSGCDAVVHCAIGTDYGQRREIFAVTVDGTRRLAAAALAAGVSRFVHLSSIAVHGNVRDEFIDEATPVRPSRRDDYSESKAQAERLIEEAARAGLPAVILRPGCVYGPFSRTFSMRPIDFLRQGRLVLVGSADLPSNTVYIDNVVCAILRALEAPASVANGQVFAISEGDALTWEQFYGYFAAAMATELRFAPQEPAAPKTGRWLLSPLSWAQAWIRGGRQLATSPEFRSLGKRFLNTDPLGRLPRWLLERFPGLDRAVRRMVGTNSVMIYRRPGHAPEDIMKVRGIPALIRIDKARQVLGYEPVVPRERALELTLEWLRHIRLA